MVLLEMLMEEINKNIEIGIKLREMDSYVIAFILLGDILIILKL
tara:strand:+ start:380 stop:511 length:132 start_codon:yes stop_codon:yes gene_type:complete